MMKVYDMVTYGMHDPDEIAPPYGYEAPPAMHMTAIPALQLHTLQLTPTPRTETLPPSLRNMDIDQFLERISD